MMILSAIHAMNIIAKIVHTHLRYTINMRVQDAIGVPIKEGESL